jgi:hypothetical protein
MFFFVVLKTTKMKKLSTLFFAFIISAFFHQSYSQSHHSKYEKLHENCNPSLELLILPDSCNEKFIIVVNNPFGEYVRVTVSGPDDSWFSENYKGSFSRRFNMTDANDGEYLITVYGQRKVITRKIQLVTKTEITRSVVLNK